MIRSLNGDQAMAYGALSSGIRLVTSYPGSPSSGTVEALIGLTEERDVYVEWSSNERVALEMAIGASMAGRRALVCTKSVGLNVMVDPLMALNLTPLNGGMVILLGDDPGGYGSQNDQDSRPLAVLLEMPLLEPASPAEGYAMMREAYRVSEAYHSVVIIRETRSFAQQTGPVDLMENDPAGGDLGLKREPWRYVPVPTNAVAKHRDLHQRMEALGVWADQSSFNPAEGHGTRGIITAGFTHRKLLDVVGEGELEQFRLLKLGSLYPLPAGTIGSFLQACEEVLIVEETEPFLEIRIKALAHDLGFQGKIQGKESGHLGREGELYRWQIQRALAGFLPDLVPARNFTQRGENEERPHKINHCDGCGFDRILDALGDAARSLGQKPILVGDPGCLVTVADRLDAKFAIGSAVGVADGLSKADIEERAVALFGDSSFFHSALPAICNAAHNRSRVLMVVLDNQATAASGYQSNPGVDRDARGKKARALDIGEIARACGIERVINCEANGPQTTLVARFRDALLHQEPTMMIIRILRGGIES